MSLVYFDGMDQYTTVADPTSTTLATFTHSLGNQTTVATDPIPFYPSMMYSYARIFGEDRVWRVPRADVSANGIQAYAIAGAASVFNALSSGYWTTVNNLSKLSVCTSITMGFKFKFASSQPNNPVNIGAFSTSPTFDSIPTTWGINIETGNNVYIRRLYSNAANNSFPNVAWANNTFVENTTGFVGTCNFVRGASNVSGVTPPINQLASNTVEIQMTVEGKITVWINNLFVGTITLAAPSSAADVQYVSAGCGCIPTTNQGGIMMYSFHGHSDMYVLNGLGNRNTTRLGKVKVVSRVPKVDSAVQLTRPDTAESNAAVVATKPPVFGTSLTGIKQGDTDLYASDAFNFTNEQIIATSVSTTGYKTDPTGNDIAPVLSVSGTKYVGNTNVVPISNSQMKTEQYIYEVNPKTGLPFTKSELDATTFGVTVVAP